MALPAGTTIGSYEIAAPLGAGGMGEVYRARDTKLGREVALKILPDVFAADPERLARFEREAQVLASLNHPNIAIIHGVEETNGVRALVLEFVEGDTLADRIARSRIPIEEALPFARQIAEALEAAHEQGIVHRDLKPANIKVRDDGAVKVLDFGLAKLVDSSGGSTDATLSPTITSPALVTGVGMLLGTAAYMSPEQARGRMASKRADVWAFGCVLYEMLTGTRAFQGEDVADTLAAVLRGEPDWSALPKDLSPAVSALIKQCIHRDPRQRVGDMAAVLFTLRTLTGLPGHAQPKTTGLYTRKRLAAMLLLVAVVAAALTSIAWWASSSEPVPPSVVRLEITLPDAQTFPTTPTTVLAISPDGETVAYVARSADEAFRYSQRIHIRPLSGVPKPIPIAGFDNLTYTPGNPTFSPTGDSIVFSSPGDRTLKKIAVTGGAVVTLCPADVPYGISWGPDGILFGQGGGGILRVSPNPGKPTQVVRVGPNELAAFPQMLPDGDSLLFTLATVGAERFTWDEARIVVQSLKTGRRTTLIEGGSNARYVGTGHIVYAVGGLLYARTFDLNRTAVGDAVSVVEGVRRGSGSGVLVGSTLPNAAQFDVSANGTLVYIPGPESVSSLRMHLVLTDRSGKVTPLKVQPGPYQYPRASPVGGQIAYQADDGREAAIWIYDLAETALPRRLTFDGNNRYPLWSSDGRSVAFQSDREGDRAIFQQRLDDPAGAAVRLTKPPAGVEHFPESWHGDTLLFSETRKSEVKLSVLAVSKKEVAPFRDVTSNRWPNAAFSRDGRWVAYSVRAANQPRETLFVEPFPPTGIRHQVSDDDAHFPAWSPNELFYVDATRRSNRGVGFVRQTVRTKPDFATSDPQLTPREFLVSAGGIGRSRTYDILPDGQRFIGIDEVQAGGGQAAAPPIQVVLNWFEELKQRVPAK